MFEYVKTWATTAKVGDVVRLKDNQKALGVTSQDFRNQTQGGNDGEGLREALEEIGVEEHGVKRTTGYRKA